jgi:hypothetical protein
VATTIFSEQLRCLHCRAPIPDLRRRGLCRQHHKQEYIRLYYPLQTEHKRKASGRRGVGDRVKAGKRLLPGPTSHLPGTPGKVAVLEERARLGLELWHDALDARLCDIDATRETLPSQEGAQETAEISVRDWHRLRDQTVMWDPDWLPKEKKRRKRH